MTEVEVQGFSYKTTNWAVRAAADANTSSLPQTFLPTQLLLEILAHLA